VNWNIVKTAVIAFLFLALLATTASNRSLVRQIDFANHQTEQALEGSMEWQKTSNAAIEGWKKDRKQSEEDWKKSQSATIDVLAACGATPAEVARLRAGAAQTEADLAKAEAAQ
jgi:hypothetical protein